MPKLAYRSKLPRPDDPDLLASIRADLEAGVPLNYAAVHAGISDNTAYHWVWQGSQQLEQAEQDPITLRDLRELGSEAVFAQAVKESLAACVVDGVGKWREAKVNDWARWATLLERRFPADFGRRDYRQVEQRTLSVNVTAQLSPAQAEALAEVLSRRSLDGSTPALLTEGTPP